MTDAQKDTLKVRRTRLQKRGLRRVDVTVRLEDVELLRDVAAALREDGEHARWMRNALRDAVKQPAEPMIAEVLSSSPEISGPDFDGNFEDTEHSRHQPVAAKVRDSDI